ncbi:hypothetical protein E4U38_005151 [Claviceps purpurea]|nr:hypothetical protein E4U38_005151 [Claviceps purpurea]
MPEVRKVDEIEGFARLPAALALVLHAFLDIAYDVENFAVPVDRCLDKDGVVIHVVEFKIWMLCNTLDDVTNATSRFITRLGNVLVKGWRDGQGCMNVVTFLSKLDEKRRTG